jgi:PAS domain S-box-containing protein
MAMLSNNIVSTPGAGSSKSLDQISARLASPSAFGFPIYSTSGFDVLSIMARVATRPNPTLKLGPVDLSCSFLIVDVRRYDAPIVYVSPGFIALTGYAEHETLGRNCRFLQAPNGNVVKGEERRCTSHPSVAQMKKATVAEKECQTCLINYKKDGTPFMNLVSIIPLPGGVHNTTEEADQIAYHIGFQIDLSVQPDAILRKLEDGSYVSDNASQNVFPSMGALAPPVRDRRLVSMTSSSVVAVSKPLRILLANDKFVKSVPFTPMPPSVPSQSPIRSIPHDDDQLLSFTLLGGASDFIHVLSLRGLFLYVAPSVKRVLGYAAEDLVGKAISDYCHPADLVPLMRELKESSSIPTAEGGPPAAPRKVDLLYRIKSKNGVFVWVESRGRLHVESGKGRKAIILSGRVRPMPKLTWGSISQTGGLAVAAPTMNGDKTVPGTPREFWGTVTPDGTFLFAGEGVKELLGWSVAEVVGQNLDDFVVSSTDQRLPEYNTYRMVSESLTAASLAETPGPTQLAFEMRKKDGSKIRVLMVLYHTVFPRSTPSLADPLIYQVKMANHSVYASVVGRSEEQIFQEMVTSRNTSWQYELQQLRYANQRISDEIQSLEALQPNRQAPRPTNTTSGNGVISVGALGYPRPSNQNLMTDRRVPLPVLSPTPGNLTTRAPLLPSFNSSIANLPARHPGSGPGGTG